jgi:hypothetical protein
MLQWHSSQVDELDATKRVAHVEADDAHAFVTSTLEHTLNVLRPFIPKAKHDDGVISKTAPCSLAEDITNRFSKLENEELADEEVDSASSAAAEKRPATPRVTYVVDNREKERLVVAMSFLLAAHVRIKEVIRLVWKKYLSGRNIDLLTTAATTQAALRILQSIVHDYPVQFPGLHHP